MRKEYDLKENYNKQSIINAMELVKNQDDDNKFVITTAGGRRNPDEITLENTINNDTIYFNFSQNKVFITAYDRTVHKEVYEDVIFLDLTYRLIEGYNKQSILDHIDKIVKIKYNDSILVMLCYGDPEDPEEVEVEDMKHQEDEIHFNFIKNTVHISGGNPLHPEVYKNFIQRKD